MIVLIIGGSGSGKSAYAETYLTALEEVDKRYYIATMQVYDKEGEEKIRRHQKMREGKGFQTIEQMVSVEQALNKMSDQTISESAALLECVSNLTANEMFSEAKPKTAEMTAEKILYGIKKLGEELKYLVIVTNNVFEDGIAYDKTTMEYLKAMGRINEGLAVMADMVLEVVVGIPIIWKEGQ